MVFKNPKLMIRVRQSSRTDFSENSLCRKLERTRVQPTIFGQSYKGSLSVLVGNVVMQLFHQSAKESCSFHNFVTHFA